MTSKRIRRMLGMESDVDKEIVDKVVDAVDKKHAKETGLSVIDEITEKTSLMDIAKNGAFSGMSDSQRQSTTFKTGTILGASVFELGKAFDNRIPKDEAYKRGATGILGLFEILFSAKNVHDGLSEVDRRGERIVRSEKRDYDVQDYDGHEDLEEE